MSELSGDALVRLYYHTVDTADAAAVVSLFSEEAAYRRPGYPPMVGRQALLQFYGSDRVIEAGQHRIAQVVSGSDPTQVAVAGRFTGRLKDGSQVDLGFADFFTVRDSLIVARATFFDSPAV
ncbi:nuclear transport factor 2 family protein [Nocardioides carbamazepini]|uniref:nuclear transport factor 2 family protein n=1 Tax=Nocardioides carbamazepini TaxID=2854259 RepID=UPI002149EC68|nr:nuclear transport factor 2 family protein [Nocardioides carbamazepini]MCR1783811.1 nuclear transport factor 2 family protein [Nocardioides carbamazepini]